MVSEQCHAANAGWAAVDTGRLRSFAGYTFARQAPRAYPRSYASGPAQRLEAEEEEREAAAAQLQQEQLQQQSAQAEQEIGEENSISPES